MAPAAARDEPPAAIGIEGFLAYRGERTGPAAFRFALGGTEIAGRDGSFRIGLPCGRYRVHGLVVDGDPVPEYAEDLVIRPGIAPRLFIDRMSRPLLRAVEEGSGRPIAGARALEHIDEAGWKWREGFTYPGPATSRRPPLISSADGRIELPAARGPRRVYVQADGFAWRAAWLDPALRAETEVRLAPGCQLHVEVPDYELCPEVYAVLARDSFWNDEPVVPITATSTILGGLPAGEWALALRRGRYYPMTGLGSFRSGKVVVRSQRVKLEPARAASVRLDPWIDETQWVREVRGTVNLAPGWPAMRLEVVVQHPSEWNIRTYDPFEVTRVPVCDGAFRVAGLRPGEYVFEVAPTGCGRAIDVTVEGQIVALEVPPPTRCEIRIVDAESGEAIHHARLRLVEFAGRPEVVWDPEQGVHSFLTTEGWVWLAAIAEGYHDRELTAKRVSGRTFTETLGLAPAAAVTFELEREGRPCLQTGGVVALRGPDYVTGGFDRGIATFEGLKPGPYAVECGAPEGSVEAAASVDLRVGEHPVITLVVR